VRPLRHSNRQQATADGVSAGAVLVTVTDVTHAVVIYSYGFQPAGGARDH